jgi:REP element-mobilizing transposase RayT
MARLPRVEFENALYHVTSRGNQREKIFLEPADNRRFLKQLEHNLQAYQVILYAYVLMPNHFHLLVRTPKGNLHRFMQRLNSSYSLYFRYKHQRPGHVFEARYKAKLVQSNEYRLALTRYIHLNPIKTKNHETISPEAKVRVLEEYSWSSYPGYVNQNKVVPWVDYSTLLDYGKNESDSRRRYRVYVHVMVLQNDESLRKLMSASVHAIGNKDFVSSVKNDLRKKYQEDKAKDVKVEMAQISYEAIEEIICRIFRMERSALWTRNKKCRLARAVAMEVALRNGNHTLREIGARYGNISGQACGMTIKQMRYEERAFDNYVQKIEKMLI